MSIKIIRITTAPVAFKGILKGQMLFLKQHGFEPVMVSSDGPEIEEIKKNEECRHVILPMTRSITPLRDLVSIYRMYRLFRKEKPDLIHAQSIKAILTGMIAGKMARIPIRIQTMAGLISTKDKGLKSRVFEKIEKLTFSLSTNVWPNSRSSYDHILAKKLCAPEKLALIGYGSSNGIDLNRFNFESLDQEVLHRAKMSVQYDPENKYLLFVGRVVRDKGIVELADAFKILKNTNEKLKLIVIGPYENGLDPLPPETQKELESNHDIIRIGWSNEVEYYMSFADLFVFPSYREGFPNVLLQAGAMKCPVVCSKIIGNIDIVEDEKTGILFEKNNTSDLAAGLGWALDHTVEMREMSNVLYTKVVTFFDRKNVHQFLLNAYKRLLQDKK